MRKITVLTAFFCLLLATDAVFAQDKKTSQTKTTNFAGNWELDIAKSKMPERMRVESISMNVAQTDKELKVETTTKRSAPIEEKRSDGSGAIMSGGMGRSGMMDGMQTVSYSLDGKENKLETPGIPGAGATLKANIEKDGKLKLSLSRTFNGQMGEMTRTTKETWELIDGGKTLKVIRDTESPRGTQSSEMYFVKKDSANAPKSEKVYTIAGDSSTGTGSMPKQISGGVLNGKASQLVSPNYPAAAKAVNAGGAVNVQVVIDEEGNVVSASAVSGHPLLRAASEEAARNSKFSPTMLEGVPVKVTGIIVYNFTP